MNVEKLFEENKFTEAEKVFVKEAGEAGTVFKTNQTNVMASLVLGKKIERSVDRLIESNDKVANSNERQAKVNMALTLGIIFLAYVETMLYIIESTALKSSTKDRIGVMLSIVYLQILILTVLYYPGNYPTSKIKAWILRGITSRLQGLKKLWVWKRKP